ncbi:uncharacterized protein (TIGR03086 family) [Stackebrandtia albiflava]|uniref:Uncharacterized protein (TIGR03086 family) n=1 Tax=Stackebrandtia albiflava TaxID=406432 RepID=A0A562VH14_9ACTN|nr:TIGR03086 family metal-binding protein [Stackebrandtia albiflava]TWJ17131.1 uncharacterized protein (TIGR03086 family) [Stackebrandtia albiflava]
MTESQIAELYASAAATAVPVIDGIPDERLTAATPCPGYDVAGLLDHLYEVAVEFEKAARGEDMSFAATPPHRVHGEWRTGLNAAVDRLVAAWSAPEAMTFDRSSMGMPRRVVARMPVLDLVVHGWDLAVATGQEVRVDDATVTDLSAVLTELAPTGRQMGAFGAEVPVPDSAPAFDRLLGLAGRDPRWRQSAA